MVHAFFFTFAPHFQDIFCGVFIEKGIGLVVPGFTPTVLGEIYEYNPTWVEWCVSFGIFGVGAFLFTFMSRVGIAITNGDFLMHGKKEAEPAAA